VGVKVSPVVKQQQSMAIWWKGFAKQVR